MGSAPPGDDIQKLHINSLGPILIGPVGRQSLSGKPSPEGIKDPESGSYVLFHTSFLLPSKKKGVFVNSSFAIYKTGVT